MTMHVDLRGVRDVYRLCFVLAPWAYFTRLPLERQWGDHWAQALFRPFAGLPYRDMPDHVKLN